MTIHQARIAKGEVNWGKLPEDLVPRDRWATVYWCCGLAAVLLYFAPWRSTAAESWLYYPLLLIPALGIGVVAVRRTMEVACLHFTKAGVHVLAIDSNGLRKKVEEFHLNWADFGAFSVDTVDHDGPWYCSRFPLLKPSSLGSAIHVPSGPEEAPIQEFIDAVNRIRQSVSDDRSTALRGLNGQ